MVDARALYAEAVEYIAPAASFDVMTQVAELDQTMSPKVFDMMNYLRASIVRYVPILPVEPGRWLEVGCLLPAFPILLAKLGHQVTVVEDFTFYPDAVLDLYQRTTDEFGINFVNVNFASGPAKLDQRFDHASLLGVLEHLPHTPRFVLENIREHLDGTLHIDVPNVHYADKMWRYLRGGHPQATIDAVYHSGIPFVGHHREYSRRDLCAVLAWSGYEVTRVETFNYSGGSLRNALRHPHPRNVLMLWSPLREVFRVDAIPRTIRAAHIADEAAIPG